MAGKNYSFLLVSAHALAGLVAVVDDINPTAQWWSARGAACSHKRIGKAQIGKLDRGPLPALR